MSRPQLEVHSAAICVGAESIGLPTVRSIDTLFDSYFALVERLRESDRRYEIRKDDVAVLAKATGLQRSAVQHRLQRLVTK